MSLTALALIASAACAHAAWNFFAKQARGGLPFVWLAGLTAATLYALPAALQLLLSATWIAAGSAYATTAQRPASHTNGSPPLACLA